MTAYRRRAYTRETTEWLCLFQNLRAMPVYHIKGLTLRSWSHQSLWPLNTQHWAQVLEEALTVLMWTFTENEYAKTLTG